MSATYAATTATAPSAGSLLRGGAVATVLAAAATTAVAAAAQGIGISVAISGAVIPAPGFATLTVMFSVVGLLIAAALRRFARSPRTTWIHTTGALTTLSLVPDAIADADTATKAVLMLTHLLAAAIVIPAVARRLRG
jgi:hypothetical protein